MMLYVVHGNTYYYGYGHIENIYSVSMRKKMMQKPLKN